MVRVVYTQVMVSDGSEIPITESGVTLFVGPNNAGKSQSLRDLRGLVAQPGSYVGRALTKVALEKRGTAGDFREWLIEHVPSVRDESGQELRNVGDFGQLPLGNLEMPWQQPALQHIAQLFLYHADATSRLTAGNSVASINFASEVITQPLQRAYVDGELERRICEASIAAFGEPLTVDRYAGSVISLRVGTAPDFAHVNGVPDNKYTSALQQLPRLEDQGDGMRSYLGLLLHVLGGSHQVILVDEPEAFLHPPQARLLGRTLAKRSVASQQLFMATHSVDVLQGVLESDAPATVVRITREGEVNRAAVLDPEQVKELWSDPLLRYSNLLDGLFHDAVVLCESDADCRYYASVLDSLNSESVQAAQVGAGDVSRQPNLLFSHCGGKARLASVTESLRAISIPVVIVADFDVLNDEALLERTVTALGGDFEQMRANFARLHAALTSEVRPVSKIAVREAFNAALAESPDESVTKEEIAAIRAATRIESGWDKVKRAGTGGVPQGDAYQSCELLLEQLRQVGLMVVPIGELERFVPQVAGHGPKWVTEVHERKLHSDPTNEPARSFVKGIVTAATSSTVSGG